jgi:hypothetical protein
MKNEYQIGTVTDSLNPGGCIRRSKCCCGRDWFLVLERFDFKFVVDFLLLDAWIPDGLVPE